MTVYHLPRAPERPANFCRTPSAADMLQVVEVACDLPSLGTIVGVPGVGKTTTLLWYAGNDPRVLYCVMNPAQSSMSRMLLRVAGAFGTPPVSTGSARLYDWICTVIECQGPRVLLIDEAQHLDDRGLDALRCIHDETRLPIIFAGNRSLRSRVTVTREAAFAQFASRIGPTLELDAATESDVTALAAHSGIVDPKAVSWIKERCVGLAGLRIVARLMTLARDSVGPGEIRLSHLKDAAAVLGAGS